MFSTRSIDIEKYGSSVLRGKCVELTAEEKIGQLIGVHFEAVKKAGGIGLAAPQIGFSKRIFVIDTSPLKSADPSIEEVQAVYINPRIVWKSVERVVYLEGCLSVPGILADIERPERIRVRYRDEQFAEQERELDGVVARIFQHEYDHLEGILFIDRMSFLRKKFLSGKLKEIRKESKQNTRLSWIRAMLSRKQNCQMLQTLS